MKPRTMQNAMLMLAVQSAADVSVPVEPHTGDERTVLSLEDSEAVAAGHAAARRAGAARQPTQQDLDRLAAAQAKRDHRAAKKGKP